MKEVLLADRDIKFVWHETQDFTPITALRRICATQHAKTLQAVIKWLERYGCEYENDKGEHYYEIYVPLAEWQSLKQELKVG